MLLENNNPTTAIRDALKCFRWQQKEHGEKTPILNSSIFLCEAFSNAACFVQLTLLETACYAVLHKSNPFTQESHSAELLWPAFTKY